MIPRGTLDIQWSDLLYGVRCCAKISSIEENQDLEESCWVGAKTSLVCLSVRSGFDLLLQALSLPKGSEVLVSAITIPDMATILQHHHLVPVPIDIDPQTLSLNHDALSQATGPKTTAILVAHLFGSRMEMDGITEFARLNNLFIIEDCAQAYEGSQFRGHAESDVSMFSFGPIKTHTALGGGILHFKDCSLLRKVKRLQNGYPTQSTASYFQRLLKSYALKGLSFRWSFSILEWACRITGQNHDEILSNSTRGFPKSELITQIRQRPCVPLLKVLQRRITQNPSNTISHRIALAQEVSTNLPQACIIGGTARHHLHWVLPIQTQHPDQLLEVLWRNGFDATRKGSSMRAIQPSQGENTVVPSNAIAMVKKLLFLPLHGSMTQKEIQHLGELVKEFHSESTGPQIHSAHDPDLVRFAHVQD